LNFGDLVPFIVSSCLQNPFRADLHRGRVTRNTRRRVALSRVLISIDDDDAGITAHEVAEQVVRAGDYYLVGERVAALLRVGGGTDHFGNLLSAVFASFPLELIRREILRIDVGAGPALPTQSLGCLGPLKLGKDLLLPCRVPLINYDFFFQLGKKPPTLHFSLHLLAGVFAQFSFLLDFDGWIYWLGHVLVEL